MATCTTAVTLTEERGDNVHLVWGTGGEGETECEGDGWVRINEVFTSCSEKILVAITAACHLRSLSSAHMSTMRLYNISHVSLSSMVWSRVHPSECVLGGVVRVRLWARW